MRKILTLKENYNLAIVSFVILFLELLLIRLIGTEIRIFAYVPNLILLAAFIGSGLGILVKRKLPLHVSSLILIFIVVVVNLNIFKEITNLLSSISDSFIWFQASEVNSTNIFLGFFLTILLFTFVLAVFMPLGQLLGKLFESSRNLTVSYSINLLFSLMGILFFNLLSILAVPPYVSISLCMILITVITEKKKRIFSATLLFVILPFLLASVFLKTNTIWSPYQKLELVELPANPIIPPGKMLKVNNIGYMGLLDLSEKYQGTVSEKLLNLGVRKEELGVMAFRNQYDLPYILNNGAKKALLIGAGGGNDTAGALRMGVERIVAVEIDPEIIEFGKKYHPEGPYSSNKVEIINDDGRAYLQTTDERFDVVVMGLTDSHTLNSNLTNIQLDNFLYTKESLKDVYDVLEDDGILFLSFDVRRNWIGSKIKGSITNAFGNEPLIISTQQDPPIFGWGGVFFIASKNPEKIDEVLSENVELNQFVQKRKISYEDPQKYLTDNWPYLYLKKAKIPNIHITVALLLLTLSFVVFKVVGTDKSFESVPFFLGAAFLLYEFQNIGRTSLIYGNTWKTNVFIISSILTIVLIANLVSLKIKIDKKVLYFLLVASFLLQLFLPVKNFVGYPEILKYTLIPFLLNLPLLFAGFIFIKYFNEAKNRASFYASNLLGSAVGGLFSYLSYMFGINSLLYISLIFYLITYFDRKHF